MKKKIIIFICFIAIVVACIVFIKRDSIFKKEEVVDPKPQEEQKIIINDKDFDISLIKNVNSNYKNNYLISPYSIKVALSMLKEGSNNNTYTEINKVLGNFKYNDINSDNVKIANAMFLKNKYSNAVSNNYLNRLKGYNSQIIYDDFNTPDKINNWADEHTDHMINKVLDDISSDFVLGLANAVAIDVKWFNEFECISTKSKEFTKIDNTIVNVEMMHNTLESNAKYFDIKDAKGVILPYRDSNLEFVGILPNDDLNSFINNLNKEKLDSIFNKDNQKDASSSVNIVLSLPRFSYDFSLDDFKNILKSMGINDAFNQDNADFTNIITREKMNSSNINNLYVSSAVHKTYIDLNEKGTRAAAITYFGMDNAKGALDLDQPEIIKIEFNKPFVYMIRDKKTSDIVFLGVVYEPNIWKGTTCENE